MQFASLFVASILALGISAAPAIEDRTILTCTGGRVYNPQLSTCDCEPSKYYDTSKGKCCYKPLSPPTCAIGQKKWCSRSKLEYCEYDIKNEWCEDSGWGATWCATGLEIPIKIDIKYPITQPVCKDKQRYNCETKQCECPRGMWWNTADQKCHWPVMPKPTCNWPKKPWCTKGTTKYCGYDPSQWTCENDNSGISVCAGDLDLLSLLLKLF